MAKCEYEGFALSIDWLVDWQADDGCLSLINVKGIQTRRRSARSRSAGIPINCGWSLQVFQRIPCVSRLVENPDNYFTPCFFSSKCPFPKIDISSFFSLLSCCLLLPLCVCVCSLALRFCFTTFSFLPCLLIVSLTSILRVDEDVLFWAQSASLAKPFSYVAPTMPSSHMNRR